MVLNEGALPKYWATLLRFMVVKYAPFYDLFPPHIRATLGGMTEQNDLSPELDPEWEPIPWESNHPPDSPAERTCSPLESVDLAHFFGPSGPLAATLEGYELRPSQLRMAEGVKEAILSWSTALIEAPTGTGKSIAYLLPALFSGRTVVVATANKSLQSQLYTKDIPFLGQVLGREIEAVLVKGRSNYVCTYKWEKEAWVQERIALYDREDEQVAFLRDWLAETETGDVDDLPFELDSNLRPRVVSFPDDCLHRDCPYYLDQCWVNHMRDRAAEAQVVITNHHLLLTALQLGEMGERLLPPASIYVIDEAHQLESTATSVFEVEVTNYTLEQLLNRAVFKEHVDEDRLDELRFHNTLAFQEVEALSDSASYRIESDLEELKKLSSRLADLQAEMKTNHPYRSAEDDQDDEHAEERANYDLALEALGSLSAKLATIATGSHDDRIVRYAEKVYGQRSVSLRVHAAPIDPADLLTKFLFDAEERSVICTSATLATNDHFEHFKHRCGVLDAGVELVASPVFDYPKQALLYQPALPAYNWRNKDGYYDGVAGEIERLLEVSRGRALCLFTNWNGLRQVYERLSASEDGTIWPVRAQGDGARDALLSWFQETPYSVLLATRSFWEGVDLPGEDLSLVVVDKMPFPTPSDPLHSARMQALDDAEQGSSFGQYMLPLMTLSLKQGFGRLIRRSSDQGVVAILDERLTSKSYGRRARRDLPPARFSRAFRDVHHFFRDVLDSQVDFALNVRAWADPENDERGPVHWQWRLLRLQDGKFDSRSGVAHLESPVQGEIWAAVEGLHNLRGRIKRAKRTPGTFGVELRCSLAAGQTLAAGDLGDDLRKAWVNECAVWRTIDVLPLPDLDKTS